MPGPAVESALVTALETAPPEISVRMVPRGRIMVLAAVSKRMQALLKQMQLRTKLTFRARDGVVAMPAVLEHCAVTGLDLRQMRLGVAEAHVLRETLRRCRHLSSLVLSLHGADAAGVAVLAPVVARCKKLVRFALSDARGVVGSAPAHVAAAAAPDQQERVELTRLLTKAATRSLHLAHLNLSGMLVGPGALRAAAGCLSRLSGLRTLDVSKNFAGDEGVGLLAFALRRCTGLASLNLRDSAMLGCGLRGLAAFSRLSHLDVSCNSISPDGLRALGHCFAGMPDMQRLHVSDTVQLRKNEVDALLPALASCSALQVLDLGRNFISAASANALMRTLVACTRLTSLNVEDNFLDESSVRTLMRSVARHCALTRLEISGNFIADCGVAHLARSAARLSSLKDLFLDHSAITSTGVAHVRAMLAACPGLECLSISSNPLLPAGVPVFAEALQFCPRIKFLGVANVYMEDKGLCTLARALCHVPRLRLIDVAENYIQDEAADTLVALVRDCPALRNINLDDNGLTAVALAALAPALADAPALRTVHLSRNGLADDSARVLATVLHSSTTLCVLNLRDNEIGEEGRTVLAKAVHRCTRAVHVDILARVA